METEAPYFTWRRTSGAAPDAVKAARPVLNGGREETCRKVTRLAPTQRRGGGDQTGHLRIKRATGRPLRQGLRFQESARRALCAFLEVFSGWYQSKKIPNHLFPGICGCLGYICRGASGAVTRLYRLV